MSDLSRRDLVRTLAIASAAPALATGCARRVDPPRVAGTFDAVDGAISLRLSDLPELTKQDGSVAVRVQASGYSWLIMLVAARPGEVLALDGTCTHESCPTAWVPEDKQLECPCHGSSFASDGSVLNGPARDALNVYPVTADSAGNLSVLVFPGDGTFPPSVNGELTIDLANYPALQADGGYVEGRVQGWLYSVCVRNIGGTYVILSERCTHQSCRVHAFPSEMRCYCHGSVFDPHGSAIAGPAKDQSTGALGSRTGAVTGTLVKFLDPST